MLSSPVYIETNPRRRAASHSLIPDPRPLASSIFFRINTCKTVSKQTTLTFFRMNTYEKHRGVGVLLLTRHPRKGVCPERPSGVKDLSSNPKKDFYPEGAPRLKDLSSFPMSESVLSPFSLHGSRARPPWRVTFLLCVSSRRCIIGAHMEFQRIQNAIELFGPPPPPVPPPEAPPAEPPEAPRDLPGQLEPKLAIAWGDFHPGLASSLVVLLRSPFAAKNNLEGAFFRNSWVEGRV